MDEHGQLTGEELRTLLEHEKTLPPPEAIDDNYEEREDDGEHGVQG